MRCVLQLPCSVAAGVRMWIFMSVNRVFTLYFIFWRCCAISNVDHQINEEIRDAQIRVIDSDGTQLGIISSKEALDIAISKDLDLVKIGRAHV